MQYVATDQILQEEISTAPFIMQSAEQSGTAQM